MRVEGAVAVVTGGASGLGEATVRRLVASGAKAVVADLNAERGQALVDELGADRTAFVRTDVSDAATVEAAMNRAAEMGTLRAAVNCAGIGWVARTINREGSPHDFGSFQKVIEVNLIGTFNTLRLSASAMSRNAPAETGERGVVVNTASIAAYDGQIGQIAYSASKGGIVGMTLPAARDLSPVGIRVVTIAPGTFNTPLLALLPDDQRQALAANIPFPRRLGEPSEYAALVQHIVENPYLNGETIRLDGAIRMPPK